MSPLRIPPGARQSLLPVPPVPAGAAAVECAPGAGPEPEPRRPGQLALAAQLGELIGARDEAAPAPAPSTSLSVYLLGSFRVFFDDRPLADLCQGKARAIFKFLALQGGEPVAKEVLMELFWPGASPAAARNCLHVALHGLRKALAVPGGDLLQFRHGAYALNPALHAWVDTEAFAVAVRRANEAESRNDRAAAAAHSQAALALYRGALLVEDRYETWLVPYRQRLRDAYLLALERLASFARDDGDDAGCIAFTRRLLDDDACNEAAHRQLMQCYARSGQAHLALRQFHHCVDVLARELDLIPSAQTVALFQQIRKRVPV